MSILHRATVAATIVGLSIGATVLGAGAANAATPTSTTTPAAAAVSSPAAADATLHRVTCGTRTDFLWIFSNATTCWASPGQQDVALYNVTSVRGGANNGFVYQDAIEEYTFFSANQTKFAVNPDYTVTIVHID